MRWAGGAGRQEVRLRGRGVWGETVPILALLSLTTASITTTLVPSTSLTNTISDDDDWGTVVDVTARRGGSARLPCRITSPNSRDPVLLLLWYRNASATPIYSYDSRQPDLQPNTTSSNTGGTGVSAGGWWDEGAWQAARRAWLDTSTEPAHLVLPDASGRDEGSYRCKVHFRSSPSWSQSVALTVIDPSAFPRLEDESGRRLEGLIGPYTEGNTVTVFCRSSGEPPPGLVWGGAGAVVGVAGQVRKEGESGGSVWTELRIAATRDTAGTNITCSTTSTTTTTTTNSTSPTTTTTINNTIANISSATTTPIISNKIITAANATITTTTTSTTTSTTSSDIAATTSATSATITHTVSAVLTVNLAPLSVRVEDVGAWVIGGQETTFRCRVEGAFPPPTVRWTLGGQRLQRKRPLKWESPGVAVSEVVVKAGAEHHGARLGCDAFSPNLPGASLHHHTTLSVRFVPVARLGVEGAAGGDNVTVREGATITLTCRLTANPSVYNLTFYHNGRPMVLEGPAGGGQGVRRSLVLNNVTAADRGLYTCLASNQVGDGQSNALNINVEFRPVCAKGQHEEYAGERGGRVRVECHLLAYPPSLVFTWAITRIPGGAPEPLESVGREEGLTGQYTLGRLEVEKVDVWCWGRNSVGQQYLPCRFTVYTRGKPGPVSGCEATNHTASGFTVTCLAGPGRSDHTTYTITVYTQNRYKGGVTGVREDHNTSRGGGGGGVQGQTSLEGATLQEVLVANLTRPSPLFSVGGLAGGGEFRVQVVARNREGSSTPVALTTFTLNDNPQTVIRMPPGLRGRTSVEEATGDDDEEGGVWQFLMSLSPMMIIVAAGLASGMVVLVVVLSVLIKHRFFSDDTHESIDEMKVGEGSVLTLAASPGPHELHPSPDVSPHHQIQDMTSLQTSTDITRLQLNPEIATLQPSQDMALVQIAPDMAPLQPPPDMALLQITPDMVPLPTPSDMATVQVNPDLTPRDMATFQPTSTMTLLQVTPDRSSSEPHQPSPSTTPARKPMQVTLAQTSPSMTTSVSTLSTSEAQLTMPPQLVHLQPNQTTSRAPVHIQPTQTIAPELVHVQTAQAVSPKPIHMPPPQTISSELVQIQSTQSFSPERINTQPLTTFSRTML